jgi:polysaccharide export outer membrane protein
LRCGRGASVLLLVGTLLAPQDVEALPRTIVSTTQEAAQQAKPKRPPLRARVVTAPGQGGVVVVPAAAGAADAAPTETLVSGQPNVTIRVDGGPIAESVVMEPEVENWLVGGPSPASESWLQDRPVARAAETTPLLGVQHYMEATQADRPASSVSPRSERVPVPAPRTSVPARTVGTAVPPQPLPNGGATGDLRQRGHTTTAAAAGTYRLGPGDEIDVHVWRNPDLSRTVPVRPDGLISLPLVGELRAEGSTVAELNAEITAILEEFVQRPTVTVSVTEVRSMVVYVNGRVASPGTLVLERPINVMQAIAMAGGLQEFADRNGVVVIRTVNGERVRIPFRYGDAVSGKGAVAEFVLQSGDVVYVP